MEMPEATARRMIEKLLLEEEHKLIILKRTVIDDQTAPDDWGVLLNGEAVGRFHLSSGIHQRSINGNGL